MFLPFFQTLREEGVPVSLREFLGFLEAMAAGLVIYDPEGFYHLARLTMVKGERHIDRFDRAFARGFRDSRESLPEMIAFAQAHAGPIAANHQDLGRKVAAMQLARVQHWAQRQALDGKPAIDAQPFNEFPMWLALGFGDLPYELVLTNQLIAGVEFTFPAVHTAIRGGYSNGITSYGQQSRFGTFSVWSTYAFTADDDDMVKLRGGERYTPEEAAKLAGLSGAHEIGHQLFHFTHPFGQQACLMSPVPMFGYRAWAEKLSAKDCPVGSSPAMTPGAYRFDY